MDRDKGTALEMQIIHKVTSADIVRGRWLRVKGNPHSLVSIASLSQKTEKRFQ